MSRADGKGVLDAGEYSATPLNRHDLPNEKSSAPRSCYYQYQNFFVEWIWVVERLLEVRDQYAKIDT